MADEAGLSVGRIFAKLGFAAGDDDQIAKWRRERDQAEQQAKKPIDQKLGFDVDDAELKRYQAELDKVKAQAKRKEDFKAKLGADFDESAFRAYERESARATAAMEKQRAKAKESTDVHKELNKALGDFNRQMTAARNLVGLIKWPALITGAGLAAQAFSELTAGAVALGSALAPIGGAAVAYPALGSAAAQGLGTWKLATQGLGTAVGGLNEKIDTQSKAFKALSPEAQTFAKHLDSLKPQVRDIQQSAQQGLFPGLDKGLTGASKNLPIFNKIAGETAKAMGGIAEQAGKMLGSKAWGKDFETQGGRNTKWIKEAGDVGLHLANALRNVVIAGGPLVDWLVKGVDHFAKLVDHQAAAGRESGKLAHFFDETRVAISRVVRIGADLATAFFNIGKEGKPLGDDILVNLVKVAEHFKDWTQSASGQNQIVRYFREARAPIFELGKLVHDIVTDFFKLGHGNQLAPLIHTIRVDLLPRFVELVRQTTKSFGPAFFDAVKNILDLFITLGGTNGPLTQTVTLVGKVAGAMDKVLGKHDTLKSALVTMAGIGGLAKVLGITSAIGGVGRLITQLKLARTAAILLQTAEGGATAGGAGTAARTTTAARTVAPGAAAGLGATAAGAVPAAVVAAGSVVLLNIINDKLTEHSRKFASALDVVTRSARQLSSRDNIAGLRTLADSVRDLGRKGDLTTNDVNALERVIAGFSRKAADHAHDVAQAWGRTLPQVARDTNSTFAQMARNTAVHMSDIRKAVSTNTSVIRQRLGKDTDEGRRAMATNFQQAAKAVQAAMDRGTVSTRTGTAEIRRLMVNALKQMGFTGEQADRKLGSGLRGGQVDQSQSQRQPGQGLQPRNARGGYVRRAVGGWIGRRGMVSGDVVPIGEGALAAYGEYDAHGPGGERAILNRHQAPIAEAALAAGGYPGLDHLPAGRQLPVLERALAPMGGLDRLFQKVTRPHYLAQGGRFQGGGGVYNKQQLMQLWVQAGGPASVANIAAAIALAESGGNANARNSIGATGLWQIYNGPNTDPGLRDPVANARAAVAKYRAAHGFTPWTTYTGADTPGHERTYLRFLGAGAAATAPFAGGAVAAPTIRAPQLPGSGGIVALINRGLGLTTQAANDRLQALAATISSPVGGGTTPQGGGPAGTTVFKGITMAQWVAAALRYAQTKGVESQPTSGYRPGFDPHTASGASEHQGTQYPHGAVDFGSFTSGLGPKMAVVNATRDFKWPLLAPIGFRDDGHASGTGHALGGFLRRFQGGGRLGIAAGRIVGRGASGVGTKLHIKSLASMQTDRNGRFDAIMGRVDDARADYQRWDARYNLTDEGELIDQTTGEPNVKAINQKLAELSNLAITRKFIEDQLEQARGVARQIVKTYNTIIRSLTRSLRHAKGKDRSGIRSRIKTYQGRLDEWRGKLKDVGGDVFEAHTDVLEIQGELADARAALGGSADIRQQYAQSLADAASQGVDTGGGDTTGADTTTPDAAPAPPTAADIAAAAYQDVQAYLGQQRDLLTSFAGNAYTPRQAVGAGGVFSGHPDLQGAALGALRGFGGGADLAGSLGGGRGGPVVVVQDGGAFARYDTPITDAPTHAAQLRFIVENAG